MKSLLISECPSCILMNSIIDGSLQRILPEVHNLINVPQNIEFHPECNSLVHTVLSVQYAANKKYSPIVRLGALLHDIGKYITYSERENLHGHEEASGILVDRIFTRESSVDWIISELPIGYDLRYVRKFCKYIALRHLVIVNYENLSVKKIVKEISHIHNIFGVKSLEAISCFVDVADSDKNGRLQNSYNKDPALYFWSTAYNNLEKIGFQELNSQEYHRLRLQIIHDLVNSIKV